MKALIIGNQDRYEKYMPQSAFADSLEKVYFPLDAPLEDMLPAAADADFLAADAIAAVPAELIEAMPKLKLIHSEGVGYNGIPVETAAKRGIPVCNNKGANAGAVAEQAVLLMLGLLRNVIPGNRAVMAGRQIQVKEESMLRGIRELADCQIGLVGFGDIGKALALRLRPFGCSVCYTARSRKSPETEEACGVVWAEMDELLSACDIVSLHVPVTPETAGMADASFFSKMKPGAYFVNTSRGELADNAALLDALRTGRLAGAGLDTLAPEPVPADHMLLHLPQELQDRILLSPHIGGITESTFRRSHRNIWAAFEACAAGKRPDNIVNGL